MLRLEPTERYVERASLFCGAALAAALLATGLAYGQDSPPATPAQGANAGGEPVALEADLLTNDDAAQTLTAEGNVEARFQGRSLRADRVVYNLRDGTIHASGNVQLVDRDGGVRYADELEIDEDLQLGVATELQARIGETGRFAARTAVRRDRGRSSLTNIIYTSCPICEDGSRPPTWALRARRAVQDTELRTISYQGAVLEVMGVPILYLPFFAHSDPTAAQATGFLTPDFGRNRRVGIFYQQPYHIALSPHQDITLALQVHENVRPLAGIEYRKRFWSGDLNIQTSVTYEQDFDGDGQTFGEETYRSHVFASGRFDINDYWLWGFGAERVSDDLYLRRYDIDGAGVRRGPFVGDAHRLISQLYLQGQDANSFATVNFISFQGLREFDDPTLLPLILPFGEYERVLSEPILDGQVRFRASSAVLERTGDDIDTARVSAGVSWRAGHVVGPGLIVSPFAEGRVDAYRINDPLAPEPETFTRAVGVAGAEVSWPFVRPGENVDLLVEPILMAAVAGGENDPRIINEDSIGFELDDSNLFRPNAAPNYDLWETGTRVSFGVRATARTAGGQSASFLFGRRWRAEDDAIFTPDTNLDGNATDWVGAANVDLGPHFGTQLRVRLDDETLDVNRVDVSVRGAVGRFSAQARYYSIDDSFYPDAPSRELAANVGVQLARGWEMQYELRRDLDSDINISQDVRAIYRDDCTFLELSYSRSETFDRTLGPNEGFQIRVGLTSLGVFGGGD